MTLREDLVQKEVADISENYTSGIPVIDKHFRTMAIFFLSDFIEELKLFFLAYSSSLKYFGTFAFILYITRTSDM